MMRKLKILWHKTGKHIRKLLNNILLSLYVHKTFVLYFYDK